MVELMSVRVVPETWALVPARSGSKSVPDKNLQSLQGHSLLAWAIVAGVATPEIARTFVSTDSHEYARIGKQYGASIPFIRPAELASDSATDSRVFAHFLNWAVSQGCVPWQVVHLRPTTPTRDPLVLSQAIADAQTARDSATAIRSVHPAPESPFKWFMLDSDGWLTSLSGERELDSSNSSRDAYPTVLVPNGYVDVIYPERFLDTGRLHGSAVRPLLTPQVVEVDNLFTLRTLRAMKAVPRSLQLEARRLAPSTSRQIP